VIDLLLAELLRGVRRTAPVDAFAFATELNTGLEALPRQARAVTHEALVGRGFTGTDRWLYLRAAEAGPPPDGTVRCSGDERGLHLERRDAEGVVVGSADVAVSAPGLGILWWLEIEPGHKRRGHGRQLLRAARTALAEWGATETTLVVDHDDPSDRDRRPAVALYLSEGYEVVDHLWQYSRGERPVEV
jgi:ribosomal protein S18 acetylase RimI-like enzyme